MFMRVNPGCAHHMRPPLTTGRHSLVGNTSLIKEESLNRVVPLGERHLRRTIADFVAHYHGERNHLGLSNERVATGLFAAGRVWAVC
jgi:hypothetical protein